MPEREKVIRGLEDTIGFLTIAQLRFMACGNGDSNTIENCIASCEYALALLKEQETMPSYNDAVDTIKFQSKVIGLACEILAGWESEDPCNTLFYIKEQRQKCEDRCCCDKTPDEWCWRRYLALMATEDSDAE